QHGHRRVNGHEVRERQAPGQRRPRFFHTLNLTRPGPARRPPRVGIRLPTQVAKRTGKVRPVAGSARRPGRETVDRMIEVNRLTKRYGATTAVDGLSFTVRPGHVT